MITQKTYALLGIALYYSQKLEYALYGLAAHYSHIPEAQKEKRFREMSPEKFLRGDLSELKSTLGQIATAFGPNFHIDGPFLDGYIERRNSIVHNFWRHTADRRADAPFEDPDKYLTDFALETEQWIRVMQGVLSLVAEGAAKKEGREDEFSRSTEDAKKIEEFLALVVLNRISRDSIP